MQREIKFRAWWQPVKLEYHKGKITNPPKMLQVSDDSGTKTGLDCCGYANQGQNVILMQYTGLKDKNGKEIYEGDIVNLIPDGYVKELATVEWDNDNASWIYRRISQLELVNKRGVYVKWKPIEVIGNIHENPELLEANHECLSIGNRNP